MTGEKYALRIQPTLLKFPESITNQFVVLEVRLEWQVPVGDGGEQAAQPPGLPLVQRVAGRLGRRRTRLQDAVGRCLVATPRVCHTHVLTRISYAIMFKETSYY